jgi:ABC-type multidrug transport system fused ATPase/permease subunit
MNPQWKQAFELIRPMLGTERWTIARMLTGNLCVAIGEATLLLMLQPFLKVFFQGGDVTSSIDLLSQFPSSLKPILNALQPASLAGPWLIDLPSLRNVVVVGILGAGLLRGVGLFLFNYHHQVFMLKLTERLRADLVKHLLFAPFLQIQQLAANQWMSRILNDTNYVRTRGGEAMASVLINGSRLLVFVPFLFWHSWFASLVLLCLAPFLALGLGKMGMAMQSYADSFQRQLANMAQGLLELRERFEFIKVQQGDEYERERFSGYNHQYFLFMKKTLAMRALFAPMIEWLGVLGICSLILFLVWMGQAASIDLTMINFAIVFAPLVKIVKNLVEAVAKAGEAAGALREVMQFTAASPLVDQRLAANAGAGQNETFRDQRPGQTPSEKKPGLGEGPIEIQQVKVTFAGQTVLDLREASFRRGSMIAIIGASGSGKSTLLRTLGGLVSPEIWSCSYSLKEVVSAGNFVSQTPFFFEGSLSENLRYGLSPQEIQLGASLAQMTALLDEMRLGNLKTLLSSSDASDWIGNRALSGGELQRLTIARALLRNKELLLCDEITSSLDLATELQVLQLLQRQVKQLNWYALVVTHRLQNLHLFAEVWRMDKGQIIDKFIP